MCQDKLLIETIGYIKKEENLVTVENNVIPHTLVLESSHPFPGYHGKNLPEKSCPRSLFLIVNKDYSFEQIARVTKKIKQGFKYDFNASQGNIYLKSSSYPCIRIKYLESFTFLPELQYKFLDEGIKFAKHRSFDSSSLIIINKHFYIEEIEEGIYNDMLENSKFYIELPVGLKWDEFKEITHNIKNNIDNSNFDAAQGVFYRKEGIIDVVRLYICEGEIDRVKLIQKMYIDQIKKKYK